MKDNQFPVEFVENAVCISSSRDSIRRQSIGLIREDLEFVTKTKGNDWLRATRHFECGWLGVFKFERVEFIEQLNAWGEKKPRFGNAPEDFTENAIEG